MKSFNRNALARVLSLMLVLCMVIGCFAGCSKDKKSKEKDIRDELDDYTLNGLTYYIGEEFGRNESDEENTAFHTNDDEDMSIQVFCGSMDEVAENMSVEKIRNSKQFAKEFTKLMDGIYDCETDSANDVYYALLEIPGEGIQVCGFYVEDDYGWIIIASSENEKDEDDLINYVTLAQIDKDFDADDYISDDDDDAFVYEDEYEEQYEEAYAETTPPTLPPSDDYSTFTVYAYIPASWGYPGIWAWSETTGENVFAAWPGQPMDYHDGFMYSYELPRWAEYLIINGNDGTIQTEDEPIQSYDGVWVIVNADGSSYGIYFSEPTEQDFQDHGY